MRLLNEFATGTYEGTGAAVSVSCGFSPLCVIVWNEEDGDELFIHIDGMTDAHAIKIAAAVSALTSQGITLSSTGFSVGTGPSESGKTHRYLAF